MASRAKNPKVLCFLLAFNLLKGRHGASQRSKFFGGHHVFAKKADDCEKCLDSTVRESVDHRRSGMLFAEFVIRWFRDRRPDDVDEIGQHR
ncbi:MAG: hypothetical protein RI953_1617 [Pseudomonadota bacterium]